MNDMKVFSSTEFGELGVMLIDGKEYFPATQCANILGYSNPRDAIKRHCRMDGVVKHDVIDSLGRTQQMKFINEGNLYRLIVSSRLPAAEKFERWVFDEVLPKIRRTGSYGELNIEELITKTATAVVSEVMKQLAPVMLQHQTEVRIEAAPMPKHKKPRKASSKISRLAPPIRTSVEEMLRSDAYTFQEIADYIGTVGVSISVSAVCRYYDKIMGRR